MMYLQRRRMVTGLLALAVLSLPGSAYVQAKETSVRRPSPPAPPLPIEDKFFCSAVLGASLRIESRAQAKDSGIKGILFDATDRIAIKVEGDKLHFLTRASFEARDVEDESPFNVLVNDNDQLVAIDYDTGRGAFINTFSLNRKTGVAVWSKSRSIDFFSLSSSS